MKPNRFFSILACLLLLSGCGRQENIAAPVQQVPKATVSIPETVPGQPVHADALAEGAALAELPAPAVALVLEPEASGILTEAGNEAVIDYSNSADGYVMAQFAVPSEARLKVLVAGPTTTYSYNLPPQTWTAFPLSDGNGSYTVGVYRNVSGTKYAKLLTVAFEAELRDEFAPFLRPNQYVNYTAATKAVDKGLELTRGLEQPLDKVAAVYDYVVGTLTYDHEKAATVKSGYLPDLDQVLEIKTGICFDYAALMTAMLRSQQIPCKLVVGYAGSTYHAWISVWTQEHGWIDGAIFFDGQVWTRMDPTFASSGGRSDEIMRFITEGSYTAKYLY